MEKFSDMTVVELRQKLRELGLSTAGNKAKLVERLCTHQHSEQIQFESALNESFERRLRVLENSKDISSRNNNKNTPPLSESSPSRNDTNRYEIASSFNEDVVTRSMAGSASRTFDGIYNTKSYTDGQIQLNQRSISNFSVAPTVRTGEDLTTLCQPSHSNALLTSPNGEIRRNARGGQTAGSFSYCVATTQPPICHSGEYAAGVRYNSNNTTSWYEMNREEREPTNANSHNTAFGMQSRYHQTAATRRVHFAGISQPNHVAANMHVPTCVQNTYPSTNMYCDMGEYATERRTCSDFGSVQNIVGILPTFDPSVKELTSAQFIGKVEPLRQAYGWSDKLLLFAVSVKMKGCAKLWLDSASEVYTNWSKFVSDFLFEFPAQINAAEIHMRLMSMRRALSETPETFYYRVLSVSRQGGLDDQSIIKYVLNGINDIDMKRSFSAKTYNHATELLRAIVNYCSFNTYSYKPNSVSKLDVSREKHAQQTSKNNNKNKERKENQNIVCYNCRKPGHISRNCTEPQKRKKCTKCNKYGHDVENCEVAQKSKCNTIEENKDNFNMKMVKINSVVVEALIDSGSARSLIKRNFANKFENNLKEKCFVRLKGFAGGEYECFELMKSNIVIDDVCVDSNLLIIDDSKLDYDVLVGRDVLCTNGNIFVIDGQDC